jgi:hypothetical protein
MWCAASLLPDAPSAHGSCSGACLKTLLDDVGGYPSDGFECDTGHVIPHAAACDDGLVLDCNAFRAIPNLISEDEANCPKFTCATGFPQKKISERYHCDGLVGEGNGGCADGSDEAGCASYCE